MTRVAIFYCKKVKDHSCVACMHCFRGAREKAGEFAQHPDDVEIVAMTDCGDCPGLLVQRANMVLGMLNKDLGGFDAIHLGTCVKMAYEHGNCPMDLDEIKLKLQDKFKKPLIIGTHYY